MHNSLRFGSMPFSVTQVLLGINGILVIGYFALIAVVMSYAALTVEFSQSVRSDEAVVAALETQYLNKVAEVSTTNFTALGYTKPSAVAYVQAKSGTALR